MKNKALSWWFLSAGKTITQDRISEEGYIFTKTPNGIFRLFCLFISDYDKPLQTRKELLAELGKIGVFEAYDIEDPYLADLQKITQNKAKSIINHWKQIRNRMLKQEVVRTTKPLPIWASAINLSGLWGPVYMTKEKHIGDYWDKSGNLSVSKLGLNIKDGIITFASTSEKDVELWTSGIKSAMHMISKWCYAGKKLPNR